MAAPFGKPMNPLRLQVRERPPFRPLLNFRHPSTRDQADLKLYRLIPSFLIFDSSVCLGMPSLAAAPLGPEIWPVVSRSASSIIRFSRSARFAISGTLEGADLGATSVSQVSSTQNVSPSHRITARSTTF